MDIEQFRKNAYAAVDQICDYYSSIEARPVQSLVEPGYIRSLLPDTPPQDGAPFDQVMTDFQRVVLPGITSWQHPGFFAFYPANSSFECIISDMFAGAVSNPGFNWACSPACTELEVVMVDWVAKMLGLSSDFWASSEVGGGVIQQSASESVLVITVAARERAIAHFNSLSTPIPRDVVSNKLVMYGSTETHSLGLKAGLVFGVEFKPLPVRKEDNYSLRGETLRKAIEEDVQAGKFPFLVIATLGSTSSGAIDHIGEICQVSKDYPSLYVHVDAAWGGVFLSCPEFRKDGRLDEINASAGTGTSPGHVHSVCTNMHKAGMTTFDASLLWIRDRKMLTDALNITPPFLRSKHGDQGTVIDYRNWNLGLGRRFRSLKILFVLRSYGISGFQAHIRRHVELAKRFEGLVKSNANFELVEPRRWALVVFRIVKPGKSAEELNDINKRFHQNIGENHEILLTPTSLMGIFCIRFAVGGMSTQEKHIDNAWRLIQQYAEQVL